MREQCIQQEQQHRSAVELGYCRRCGALSVRRRGADHDVCPACAAWLRWLHGEARP